MATITFTTLQTRVNTRVIDLPTAVSNEVPTLINDAIHFLCAQHNFKVMEGEVDFNTSSSTTSHTLGQIPSDFKEPRGEPYYLSSVGWTKEMLWQPNRQMVYRRWAPLDPNQIGPPRDLLLGEASSTDNPDPGNPDQDMSQLNIEVYPFSDGNSDWATSPVGQYRIKVPYWRYLPDLSAGGDHNWFTDWCDRFIVDYATADAFALDWDEQRSSYWMAKAVGPNWDGFTYNTLGGWARQAINRDSSIKFAPGKTLVPRRDVNAPRDQWRQ
jgi:hypothetical protein